KLDPSDAVAGNTNVALGATFATETTPEYSVKAPSRSITRARTVSTPLSAARQLPLAEDDGSENAPPPQSNAYVSAATSALDGSTMFDRASGIASPSFTVAGAEKSALGATFIICTVPMCSSNASCGSMTFAPTSRLPLSVVGQLLLGRDDGAE